MVPKKPDYAKLTKYFERYRNLFPVGTPKCINGMTSVQSRKNRKYFKHRSPVTKKIANLPQSNVLRVPIVTII